MTKLGTRLLIMGAMLFGLPLVGVVLAGHAAGPYLQFPPLTRDVSHAPFSWIAFAAVAGVVVLFVTPFVRQCYRCRTEAESVAPVGVFPWWGWSAAVLGAVAWVIAWNRFVVFDRVQLHMFTPLWLAFIVVINALTARRIGRCMMMNRPVYFLSLFPVSAAFWWFFEYLNRFVQNWYYAAATLSVSGIEYVLYATLPFSTVLPAVLGTRELLGTYPAVDAAFSSYRPVSMHRPKAWAAACLAVASAGLAGIGVWPDLLFPMVWVSPLLIIVSLNVLFGEASLLREVANGDWRRVVTAATAGLVCGLFWEMWNVNSLAHWVYSIPFVHGFKIFEMPVLGYAGYLPFGVACLAIGDLVQSAVRVRRSAKASEPESDVLWTTGLRDMEGT